MVCTTCGENRAYGVPKTEAERLATHSAIYGTTDLPPRGTGVLGTLGCSVCGNAIEVPTGAKEFTCRYCGSVYEITSQRLGNGWLWPFVGGMIVGFIVFTGLGRAMVKTVGEATLTELEAATARRKAKLAIGEKAEVW